MLGRLALAMVVGSTAVACGTSGGDHAAPRTSDHQPPGHPNIVFFLTDDQSANQMVALPSVKELIADRGVTFTNAIAPVPLCCPARASLLTGRRAAGSTGWTRATPLRDGSTMPATARPTSGST